MKIITRQSNANEAPERWRRQYCYKGADKEYGYITEKLLALRAPIDPNEIDRIIGNTSWTKVPWCSECKTESPSIVVIGVEPAHLCPACLRRAVAMLEVA